MLDITYVTKLGQLYCDIEHGHSDFQVTTLCPLPYITMCDIEHAFVAHRAWSVSHILTTAISTRWLYCSATNMLSIWSLCSVALWKARGAHLLTSRQCDVAGGDCEHARYKI